MERCEIMENRNTEINDLFKVTIFRILVILCASATILFIILPSPKHNSIEFIMKYALNVKTFEDAKSELLSQKYESILLRKNKTSYSLFYNDKKQTLSDNKLKKTIELMENVNAEYIEKDKDNITVNFTSAINFAQNIVYEHNREDFMFNHIVSKQIKLKNNWYYVEEK